MPASRGDSHEHSLVVTVGGAIALLTIAGCTQTPDSPSEPTTPEAVQESPAPATLERQPLCAEFPASGSGDGPDFEGWWNSTPADADGKVIHDPERWPTQLRDHPRVAVVRTDPLEVISTWDRVVCGPDETFAPDPSVDWTADGIVLVDMDTGETLDTFDGALE
ncbi:hypothetical protein J4G33_11835 [Actinotalea sp. BY-33]|uniref:Uncharacterized protein n=1 Tax=Actinotalea soli TaxID=2819234 RepID=A0A939LWE1_9CELL|nr:hypothetical protein [Actinotalea soli]